MANAITFKRKEFKQALAKRKQGIRLVHRLDGPYSAARYEHDPRKEGKRGRRSLSDQQACMCHNLSISVELRHEPPARLQANGVSNAPNTAR
eukprot:scaffold595923_cov48-Prasinocladus_malaysianus.AAC.1